MEIAEKIKKSRKKIGLSQKELAEKTGLSIASIQGYEQGKYKPKIETMQKLAVALGISFAELIGNELQERHRVLQRELNLVIKKDFEPPAEKERIIKHIEKEIGTLQTLIDETRKEEYKENQLICEYRKLNESGQGKAIEQIELLTKIPEYRKEPEPQDPDTPK